MSEITESAGPEVIEGSTEGQELQQSLVKVTGAVAKLDKVRAGMAALRKQFPVDVVLDASTKAGMKIAVDGRAAYRSIKGEVETVRKDAKAPLLLMTRKLDEFAGDLKAELQAGQDHYDAAIEAEKQRKAAEQAAREQAEAERTAAHRDRIADIANVAVRAVGMSSAEIEKRIRMVTEIVVDASLEEFQPHGIVAKAETLQKLGELLSNAKLFEEREREAEANRQRLAELERENAERQLREAEERRVREAAEADARRAADEKRAAEQQAEQAKLGRERRAAEMTRQISTIQRRSMTSTADGLLALVTEIEALEIGEDLGEAQAATLEWRTAALADLHDLHKVVVKRDADTARAREEQRAAQKRLDDQQAEIARQQTALDAERRARDAPVLTDAVETNASAPAGPVSDGIRDSNDGAEIPAAKAGQDAQADQAEVPSSPGTPGAYASTGGEAAQIPGSGDKETGAHADERAPASDDDVINVAVVSGFDSNNPIGWMKVRRSALPPTPDFVFSLGFRALEYAGAPGTIPTAPYISKYELLSVSPVTDTSYIGYLQQIGLVPTDADNTAAAALMHAVVDVMKAATAVRGRGKSAGSWSIPAAEMTALKAALRKVPLPGGQFYSEDGTLMNADGTRSVFDDVDQ